MTDARIGTYLSLRVANSTLGLVGGVIQVGLYTRFVSQGAFAFVLAIGGIASFAFLSDLGLGRPLFAKLRRRKVKEFGVGRLLGLVLPAWVALGVGLGVTMPLVAVSLSALIEPGLSLGTVLAFGAAVGIQAGAGLLRPVFLAIDEHLFFEWMDIVRRAGLVTGAALSAFDPSLRLTSGVILIAMVVTAGLTVVRGLRYLPMPRMTLAPSVRMGGVLLRRFGSDSRDALGFALAEMSLYSGGWVLLPPLLNATGLATYGVFMRLFQAAAVLTRMPTDVLLPRWSRHVVRDASPVVRSYLVRLSVAGGFAGVVLGGLAMVWRKQIQAVWLDDTISLSFPLAAALTVWLVINGVRHPAGSVLLSTGRHFASMRRISSSEVLLVLAALSVVAWSTRDVALAMMVSSLPYAGGTGVLLAVSRRSFGQGASRSD